ncbi:MAG TPA: PGF-pre-PGF domain-containing protein [Thermoplasmata archaeon]|nr:PGF-pre-PGF domain-containing protein [Thermoplasmata archaeon]
MRRQSNILRYHNNEWRKLSTTIKNESTEYVYYEAEIPGLSTFAIVGSTLITQPSLEPSPTTSYFTQPLIIYTLTVGAATVSLTIGFLLYYRKHS